MAVQEMTLHKIRTGLTGQLRLKKAKVCLRLMGNSLGFKNHLLYSTHHRLSRFLSRDINPSAEAMAKAAELHREGLIGFPGIKVDEISKWVSEYFAAKPCPQGQANVNRKESGVLAPQIYQALLQVEPVLNAYFKSHFQCYWVAIDHMEVGFAPKPESSFSYHLDDNPRQLMKVFFYLNDTYEQNAAFRAFNYETTKELIRKGFISLTPELRVSSQKYVTPQLEKEKLKIIEGPQGTALIFDNNIIHKGTPPRTGFRNVVVVEVYPSSKRFSQEAVFNGLTRDFKRDYPLSPFQNDLQA